MVDACDASGSGGGTGKTIIPGGAVTNIGVCVFFEFHLAASAGRVPPARSSSFTVAQTARLPRPGQMYAWLRRPAFMQIRQRRFFLLSGPSESDGLEFAAFGKKNCVAFVWFVGDSGPVIVASVPFGDLIVSSRPCCVSSILSSGEDAEASPSNDGAGCCDVAMIGASECPVDSPRGRRVPFIA